MPFGDGKFDAVVSSGSLHHWEDPVRVFDEITRVTKAGGRVIIRDSRRLSALSLSGLMASLIGLTLPPDFCVHYWSSIRSSYTPDEVGSMVARSRLRGSRIAGDMLDIMGIR